MKKQVIVLSLGGSLIIPDNVDIGFLLKFKKIILRNTKKYKFVVVCGGGSIARKYIAALREAGMS
ncbi:MAG: UMP kinase, partial [Nanoarchaeota archaeon]